MKTRFVPSPENWSATKRVTPSPRASRVMTAATPIMMPSMVRAARSLLADSPLRAMRMFSMNFIP